MGFLGRVLLTFIVLLGSTGLESASTPKAACACCDTTLPEDPCGCGMPQQSNSQRCGGGQQAPTSAIPSQPKATTTPAQTNADTATEAKPCPTRLSASANGREPQELPAQTFGAQEGPPRSPLERQALLRSFRI